MESKSSKLNKHMSSDDVIYISDSTEEAMGIIVTFT